MEIKLLKALLSASNSSNSNILPSLLSAIASVYPCKLCSLWKLNNSAQTLSVYARTNYTPSPEQAYEYVHPVKDSLIGFMLDSIKKDRALFINVPSVREEPYWSLHMSKERVKALGLKRLICIPIPNLDNDTNDDFEIDAILNIYVDDDLEFVDSHAEFIRDQLSIAISRARLFSREQLTTDIIEVYKQRAGKDFSSIVHPIINNVFPKYFKYEGCSIFIWDPFYNRFCLSQTTGLKTKPVKSTVYYSTGEGLTGCIAEKKEPILINDLNNFHEFLIKKEHIHKWEEETSREGQSFMGIPIMSPSNPNDVVGIIRFINRLNPLVSTIDYFSQEDCDLINHACNLIALYMESEQSARKRTAFAMQMAHEMLTPAFGIRGSADRLLEKWHTGYFNPTRINRYLADIVHHAELQITLTRTIEYMWRGTTGASKAQRYQVEKCDFYEDVLEPSKKLVIPIVRNEGLLFDNITFIGTLPKLCIDKYAFQQVIFNLLTNSVKYRKPSADSFYVTIELKGLGMYYAPDDVPYINDLEKGKKKRSMGYMIVIEDNGIGIEDEETNKIFLFGYRKKGIEMTNVRGLGIGLTVTKSILSDFNCRIWVSQRKDPTIFNIFLPEMLNNMEYTTEDEWKKNDGI